MIDLYHRLRIRPNADEAEITAATNRVSDPDIRHRARAILLNPSRRPAYDRMWSTMSKLGHLRAHLGLNDAPFGQRQEYSDFCYTLRKPKERQARKLVSAIPGWVWVMGIIGIVWVYGELTTNPKPPLQQPIHHAPINATTTPPAPAASSPPPLAFDPSTARPVLSEPTARTPAAIAAAPREDALLVQPLPKTGARWDKTRFPYNPDNWITVTTRGDLHTLLKIVKIDSPQGEQIAAERFIRAGETLKVNLPLGTYVLMAATGQQWYGHKPKQRFGKDCNEFPEPCTLYSQADKTFPFQETGEYWEVELIPQAHGNLREKTISKSQFDLVKESF